jgi:hypothetical protein
MCLLFLRQTGALLNLAAVYKRAEVRSNDDAMKQLLRKTDAIPVMSDLMERNRPLHVQEAAAGVIGVLCTWDEGIQSRAVKCGAVKRLTALLAVSFFVCLDELRFPLPCASLPCRSRAAVAGPLDVE